MRQHCCLAVVLLATAAWPVEGAAPGTTHGSSARVAPPIAKAVATPATADRVTLDEKYAEEDISDGSDPDFSGVTEHNDADDETGSSSEAADVDKAVLAREVVETSANDDIVDYAG